MSNKPTALLIGDSICMGYRPLVKQRLEDKVNIIGTDDNGGDSSNLLKNLDEWIIKQNADLIHFNCGLHDLRVDPRNWKISATTQCLRRKLASDRQKTSK